MDILVIIGLILAFINPVIGGVDFVVGFLPQGAILPMGAFVYLAWLN